MDQAERQRLKQLANDSIIASFGSESVEQRLAEGLEAAVDELEDVAEHCEHCKTCENHGSVDDESFTVDINEIVRIHGEFKKRLSALKELHGKFDDASEVADVPDLVNELSLQIEEFESEVDELEAEVIP